MTGRRKTRFLDADAIDRGLAEMCQAFQPCGRIALVGGAALQLYGSERLTVDIDLITDSTEVEILETPEIKVTGKLAFGGVQGVTASGVPVDLIVRDDDYRDLYEYALEIAKPMEGVPIPVVPAECIVAMKLVADRPLHQGVPGSIRSILRRTKDLADLEFLILDSGLDYTKARAIVRQYPGRYAADELDRYRDSITWERSRRDRKR